MTPKIPLFTVVYAIYSEFFFSLNNISKYMCVYAGQGMHQNNLPPNIPPNPYFYHATRVKNQIRYIMNCHMFGPFKFPRAALRTFIFHGF